MKKRLKMLVAALGVTALVVSQNGVIQVNAEEPEIENTEVSTNSSTLSAVTNLTWNEIGQGVFNNPNNNVELYANVFYDDGSTDWAYVGNGSFTDGDIHSAGSCTYDLYHYIESYGKSGDYKYNVGAVDASDFNNKIMSDYSGTFTYTRPSAQLPQPKVSVSESSVVTCELSGADSYTLGSDYGFNYVVYEDGEYLFQWGNDYAEVDLGEDMTEGHSYSIRVQTLSRNINKVRSSGWTECSLDLRSNNSSSESRTEAKAETIAEPVVEAWKPTTSDEKKRYAAYSNEKVVYAAENGNAYPVTIHNAMQGKKCFDSLEAVLMDWNIGRTYNIFPAGKIIYKTNEKTLISLSIPKSLQAAGRAYKMICVTEGGAVVILEDLDSDPNTITFATDTYYAFALVYNDTVVLQ